MAVEQAMRTMTYPAAADLSTKQFYAVNGNEVDGVNVATANKAMTGILQDKPSAAGRACSVCVDGQCKAAITANQSVTVGALLQVDTGGTLITQTSTNTVVARAEQAVTGASGVTPIITVTILRSNAAFS